MKKWDQLKARLNQGWCKHMFEDGHGNVCLAGGISVVETGSPWWSPSDSDKLDGYMEAMAPIVGAHFPSRVLSTDPYGVCVDFNNHEDTTLAEVISVIEMAQAVDA